MTLTTAQYVRLRCQDQPRLEIGHYYFDGKATAYSLPHRNLTTASAFVLDAGGQWSATGSTFNTSGQVAFTTALANNSGFRVQYTYSVFSDDEITEFIDRGGSVHGAALEAVRTLMFDGLKRSQWMASDGTQFSDVAAMKLLNDIHDRLEDLVVQEAIGDGGIVGWGETQGDYS